MFMRGLGQAEESLVLSCTRAPTSRLKPRAPSSPLPDGGAPGLQWLTVNVDDLHRIVTEDEDGRHRSDIDSGSATPRRWRAARASGRHGSETDRPFLRAAHELSRAGRQGGCRHTTALIGREGEDLIPARSREERPAISASRIAAFSECGFRYFLRYVLVARFRDRARGAPEARPREAGHALSRGGSSFSLRERRDTGFAHWKHRGGARAPPGFGRRAARRRGWKARCRAWSPVAGREEGVRESAHRLACPRGRRAIG